MDNFCEQIVKPKSNTLQAFKTASVLSLTLVLGFAVFIISSSLLGPFLGFILGGLVLFLGFYILTCFSIEYEYIITNGEIDVDKIIARRKRKRILSTNVKNFSDFGKFDASKANSNSYKLINADDGIAENLYYADFKHSKFGQARLLFSPNEKALANIKPYLPRNLKF